MKVHVRMYVLENAGLCTKLVLANFLLKLFRTQSFVVVYFMVIYYLLCENFRNDLGHTAR